MANSPGVAPWLPARVAGLASWLGLALDLFEPADLQTRSVHLIDHDAAVIFVSAIGAGWAMGLVSWGCTTPGRTLEIRPEAGQKARPRRATPETAHRGD